MFFSTGHTGPETKENTITTFTPDQITKMQAQRKGTYLTITQAAEQYGININHLRHLRATDRLPADAELRVGVRGRPAKLYRARTIKAVAV